MFPIIIHVSDLLHTLIIIAPNAIRTTIYVSDLLLTLNIMAPNARRTQACHLHLEVEVGAFFIKELKS